MPACNRSLGEHNFLVAGKKYIDAVRLAGCQPLIVPDAMPDELDALLDLANGVLLTGSKSNVHPSNFGEAVADPGLPLDPARDDWVLRLIPRAIGCGIPVFAICRGFQELNVALGGSLLQAVQRAPGHADHRAPDDRAAAAQYAPAHAVAVQAGGLLERLLDAPTLQVNSLHGQGIGRLAKNLVVEARAPDGLVEAVSIAGTRSFVLGVQWHPEWQAADNPVSMRLLTAFGEACRAYRDRNRNRDRRPHAQGVSDR